MIFRDRTTVKEYISKHLGDVDIHDRSTPSYSLGNGGKRGYKTLSGIFEIPDDESLESAFRQVSSGQGNETGNLLTLHSSALLALLCFYNVPNVHIKISPSESCREYEFDKVFFEVENIVRYENDRHSSIDIALWSSNDEVLLLLESKFTEPATGGNLKDVHAKYADRLKLLSRYGIKEISESASGKFKCVKKKVGNTECYLYYDGIKQMIAHLIGVETRPAGGDELSKKAGMLKRRMQDEYASCFRKARKIFLGTILFDDSILFDTGNEYAMIQEYMDLYRHTMTEIANTIKDNRIVLITEPLTYQKVFSSSSQNKLAPKILKFYNLEPR